MSLLIENHKYPWGKTILVGISQEIIWGRAKESKDDGKMSLWDREEIAHKGRVPVLFSSTHGYFPRTQVNPWQLVGDK